MLVFRLAYLPFSRNENILNSVDFYFKMGEIIVVIVERISVIKMNVLNRIMFLFHTISFLQLMHHLQSDKRLYLSFLQEGKKHGLNLRCYKMERTEAFWVWVEILFFSLFFIWMKQCCL